MPCPVCGPIPRGLRDWLLEVFAAGDANDPLYPIAEEYLRWVSKRVVAGETHPFPTKNPGKIDPFAATRLWFEVALASVANTPYKPIDGAGGFRAGTLDMSPAMLKKVAGKLAYEFPEIGPEAIDDRTVKAAITRCLRMNEYGPEIQLAIAEKVFGRAKSKR